MICEKEKCTGCYACYNSCPKHAIKMIEDKNGYIYPEIDNIKCIDCKLCIKNCPANRETKLKYPDKCYSARAKNDEILFNSTSGGMATVFSINTIKNGGVVYGASFMDNYEVKHIKVDSLQDVNRLSGSKYVHSYIKDCYTKVKKDLDNDKEVLFIGTPCQIDGLRCFLEKEYEKLICIDLICHGVPPQKLLKEEIENINKLKEKIDKISFRDKRFNEFTLVLEKDKKIKYDRKWRDSKYYYCFLNGYTYRENCYQCKYATYKRCGDITIGDFWGLSEKSKFYFERNKGVSALIINNKKGMNFFDKNKECIEYEERDYVEAVIGNVQLHSPMPRNRKINKFRNDFAKKGFKKAFNKNLKLYIKKEELKIFVKKILKKWKG